MTAEAVPPGIDPDQQCPDRDIGMLPGHNVIGHAMAEIRCRIITMRQAAWAYELARVPHRQWPLILHRRGTTCHCRPGFDATTARIQAGHRSVIHFRSA